VTGLSFGINIECSSALMPLNTSCNLSLLLSALTSLLCLMLALLAIRFIVLLDWELVLSPGFALSIVLSLQSPLVVILLSSLLLILAMPSELFTWARLIMQLQVTKALQNVTNQSISSQTIHCNLKKSGLCLVVMRKQPLLKPHHGKEQLDFA